MSEWITLAEIDEAAGFISKQVQVQPKTGIILGSGLGELAAQVEDSVVIPYAEIPHWPVSTIHGHAGRLIVGRLENQPVMVMQGRAHFYEGYPISRIGFPIRVMQRLGVDGLIVTNAAGAIHPDYLPGDVMLIKDHINLVGMAGMNPLRGPNLDEFGERFPDMSQPYDRKLMEFCRQAAKESGVHLREGVYVWLAGPSFESPAELRFLRTIGADAVGMSTVPEVIVARHGKMRVLGISGISNKANLDGSTVTTHEEVLEAGKILVPKLTSLIRGVLRRLNA
ncbi:MAG TPA: purine-nucleoside phosphorylase [Anaerolineaceae bacterium]|nr:purine-nucleoside phosphorylase [Anaerolineaceae bacterium]